MLIYALVCKSRFLLNYYSLDNKQTLGYSQEVLNTLHKYKEFYTLLTSHNTETKISDLYKVSKKNINKRLLKWYDNYKAAFD